MTGTVRVATPPRLSRSTSHSVAGPGAGVCHVVFGCRTARIVSGDLGAVIECARVGPVLELIMSERDLVEVRPGGGRVARLARLAVLAALAAAIGCKGAAETPSTPAPQTIRVAVVGGMIETGLWSAVAERYERLTGHKVELAASGPKPLVVAAFRRGGIDLITVHASDAMVNLVADGLARDPQPWVRNDLVLVGPAADPAGIRGERDALVALHKIIAAKAKLLVHASHGADGVLHDLREEGKVVLDPDATLLFNGENQHAMLQRAAGDGAYALVGRIPFVSKKLSAPGIELMVRGDPRLRRPYLVEVSVTANEAARDLAGFLRGREVQELLATFGKGKYDDQPLFFPVTVPN